jgi:hypothetical protein
VARAGLDPLVEEAIVDKGYHKAEAVAECAPREIRAYISEPKDHETCRRTDKPEGWRAAFHANRGRIRELSVSRWPASVRPSVEPTRRPSASNARASSPEGSERSARPCGRRLLFQRLVGRHACQKSGIRPPAVIGAARPVRLIHQVASVAIREPR